MCVRIGGGWREEEAEVFCGGCAITPSGAHDGIVPDGSRDRKKQPVLGVRIDPGGVAAFEHWHVQMASLLDRATSVIGQ